MNIDELFKEKFPDFNNEKLEKQFDYFDMVSFALAFGSIQIDEFSKSLNKIL